VLPSFAEKPSGQVNIAQVGGGVVVTVVPGVVVTVVPGVVVTVTIGVVVTVVTKAQHIALSQLPRPIFPHMMTPGFGR